MSNQYNDNSETSRISWTLSRTTRANSLPSQLAACMCVPGILVLSILCPPTFEPI